MVTFVTSTVENVFFSKDDDYYQPTEAIHVSKNALSRRTELMDCSLCSHFLILKLVLFWDRSKNYLTSPFVMRVCWDIHYDTLPTMIMFFLATRRRISGCVVIFIGHPL